MATAIIMTDADRQRWTDPLTEYYRQKGLSEDKIQLSIDKVFAESQAGWERGPRDLDTRIKMKSGFQWKSHENLKPRRKEIDDIETIESDEDSSEESMFKYFSQFEKNWWEERLSTYTKDFEFNDSSDKPLLYQLLVEELMQQRLQKHSIRYPDRDFNKKLNDSLKRITELQQRLGITREQRAGILNKIDGNVAQLAVQLDEKLDQMPDKMKKDYEEELYYVNLKKQKPPINILPPIGKIEALLRLGGKTSTNVDSTKIAEINEEVAKEIAEQRETESKPKIVELPDGMDMS